MFGPASTLSLGSSGSSRTGTYSNLAVNALPQYDLASVLAAAGETAAPAPRQMQAQEQAALQIAAGLIDYGYYDEANAVLDDLLEKYPTSARGVHARGVIELQQRDYKAAERHFNQAHYLDSTLGYDEDAQVAHHLQGSDEEAMLVAQRLVNDPNSRQTGVQLLVGLSQRSPLNTDARILLAESLLQQSDAVNGLAQYRLAIITGDDEQLGRIEQRMGELVKIAPQSAYIRRLLGQTELRLGKHEQAARTLGLASELSDGDIRYRAEEAPAHVALGYDKLHAGDISGAFTSFNHARDLDYTSPEVRLGLAEAYIARGEMYTRQNNNTSALGDFQIASNKLTDGDDEALRQRLARAAFTVGLLQETRNRASGAQVGDEAVAYRIALKMDPDNITYRSKYATVKNLAGDQFLAAENYKDAAYAYQCAYELYSNNQTYRDNTINTFTLYGDREMERLQYDDAIAAYESAYDISGADEQRLKLGTAYNARGLRYLGNGEMAKARADFLAARRYDPSNTEYEDNYNSVP
ncbi:MAG: tetratricopeptide repeat protein [Planctomycetota bacterium]